MSLEAEDALASEALMMPEELGESARRGGKAAARVKKARKAKKAQRKGPPMGVKKGPWPWNGDACHLLDVCKAKMEKMTRVLSKREHFESQMVTSMPKFKMNGSVKVTKSKLNSKGKPKGTNKKPKEELGESRGRTVNPKNAKAKLSAAKILLAKKMKGQKRSAEAQCFTMLRVCKKAFASTLAQLKLDSAHYKKLAKDAFEKDEKKRKKEKAAKKAALMKKQLAARRAKAEKSKKYFAKAHEMSVKGHKEGAAKMKAKAKEKIKKERDSHNGGAQERAFKKLPAVTQCKISDGKYTHLKKECKGLMFGCKQRLRAAKNQMIKACEKKAKWVAKCKACAGIKKTSTHNGYIACQWLKCPKKKIPKRHKKKRSQMTTKEKKKDKKKKIKKANKKLAKKHVDRGNELQAKAAQEKAGADKVGKAIKAGNIKKALTTAAAAKAKKLPTRGKNSAKKRAKKK